MKRPFRIVAAIVCALTLGLVALSSCDVQPSSEQNVDGSAGSSDAEEGKLGPVEIWCYFGRTDNPLPSYADLDEKAPFAGVKDSDIVSVEAVCPLVATEELTAEERKAFTDTLRGMAIEVPSAKSSFYNEQGYPTYGASFGGTLWFDVGFADGSTWLMHLKEEATLDRRGTGVLYAGGREFRVAAESYSAFSELFSACGQRMKETVPAELKPFADLTREDVVSADYRQEITWYAMEDDEVDRLVTVLQGITVKPSTGVNRMDTLYGSNGPDQLRIVCADGSSHIVGVYGGVYIDGIRYLGSADGLNDFIRY